MDNHSTELERMLQDIWVSLETLRIAMDTSNKVSDNQYETYAQLKTVADTLRDIQRDMRGDKHV